MPIGIQRLNARRSQPNPNIIFIKPLKGPDEATAQDFLERIAAQCLPIMKEHCISVMSLEEYEPNTEFVGRNFNAGEVVQLVLKARFTGRWLPFEYVQMVMMHELAHCKQMNHSRAFWAVRNQYAEQVRQLWTRGYTGEGIWGRGTLLTTGSWEANTVMPDEPLPEHLCGGTYRSRRRGKRRAKQPELSYQERKERRILKKFGANGVALGEDQVVKAELEKGKRTTAKPRVAGSKRGRELRAAAALARFGQPKQPKLEFKPKSESDEKEIPRVKNEADVKGVAKVKTEADISTASEPESTVGVKEEDISTASESETDDEEGEDYDEIKAEPGLPDAVDIDGKTMRDGKGRGMVKVCEDENPDDEEARQELAELRSSFGQTAARRDKPPGPAPANTDAKRKKATTETDPPPAMEKPKATMGNQLVSDTATLARPKTKDSPSTCAPSVSSTENAAQPRSSHGVCTVCSFANETLALCCAVCSNVLDPAKDKRAWRCSSDACVDSGYVNAGDCGICGVCGSRRST
ncbi:hypothetical protein RB595_009213 [Gaeumannomyces hyphopodioides]